jgi:hypothetical protein
MTFWLLFEVPIFGSENMVAVKFHSYIEMYINYIGCFFKFHLVVGVEESIHDHLWPR